MKNQQHLFDLDTSVTYLNGAYMSPQLTSVSEIGIQHLLQKSRPNTITEAHFFDEKEVVRSRFAKLIGSNDPQRVAIIPSASFGIATAMHNIMFEKGDQIIVLEEQFPSNFYSWQQLELRGVEVITISAPAIERGRGAQWNQDIILAISEKTKCIAIPHCHWADGTKFDLKLIQEYAKKVDAYLIIDGTQSVGALPFLINDMKPDALICAGYKWLMGPYSLGVAYFGERFDQGIPLDNNWMNHQGSENFSNLVNYNHRFKAKAARYDIGESSNFILLPMFSEALKQLLEWTPQAIQSYCKDISEEGIKKLKQANYFIEETSRRAHHLIGVYIPEGKDLETIKQRLIAAEIFVSYRGNAIRISPNVYNTKTEFDQLVQCLLE